MARRDIGDGETLRITDQLRERPPALEQMTTPGWVPGRLPTSSTETTAFLRGVHHIIHTRRIRLPVMGALHSRVARLQKDPSTPDVVRAVESEAAACGAVIGQATRAAQGVASAAEAVAHLGDLEAIAILQEVAQNNPPARRGELAWHHLRRMWTHTAFAAVAARRLAEQLRHPAPDRVYLAALMHNVGEALLVQELAHSAPEDGAGFFDPTVLRQAAGDAAGRTGGLLLESWGFPAPFVRLAQTWEQPVSNRLQAMVVAGRQCALDYGYEYLDHRLDPARLKEAMAHLPLEPGALRRLPAEIAPTLNDMLSMQT